MLGKLLRDERQCSQEIEAEARSALWALSRVSQFPELCALARILFYVTPVRIRVFMRTLESNLLSFSSITLDNSRLVPAILMLSILCSSSVL